MLLLKITTYIYIVILGRIVMRFKEYYKKHGTKFLVAYAIWKTLEVGAVYVLSDSYVDSSSVQISEKENGLATKLNFDFEVGK